MLDQKVDVYLVLLEIATAFSNVVIPFATYEILVAAHPCQHLRLPVFQILAIPVDVVVSHCGLFVFCEEDRP